MKRPVDTSDTKSPAKPQPAEGQKITAEQVRDYLVENPSFLLEHPDLVRTLTSPSRFNDDSVVDMQHFMVERLQSELNMLSSNQSELIATTRSNMSTQSQIHRATLALLEATNFEHLVHVVTHDFSQILDIDVASISFETAAGQPKLAGMGVYLLDPGEVDLLIGPERDILLRESTIESDMIFGPASALVRSDALVRLHLGRFAPAGLLALGAREDRRFHPGQGTELLSFLARVLERCIMAPWNLPKL